MKLELVAQEQMSFKEKVTDGPTMDEDRSQQLILSLQLRWANKT